MIINSDSCSKVLSYSLWRTSRNPKISAGTSHPADRWKLGHNQISLTHRLQITKSVLSLSKDLLRKHNGGVSRIYRFLKHLFPIEFLFPKPIPYSYLKIPFQNIPLASPEQPIQGHLFLCSAPSLLLRFLSYLHR